MPNTVMDIEAAKAKLEAAERAYLIRWGWAETCQTPGSFWLWTREILPYGKMLVPLKLAISMTEMVLDEQPERGEGV